MTEKKEAPKKERKPFKKPILKKDDTWNLKAQTSHRHRYRFGGCGGGGEGGS